MHLTCSPPVSQREVFRSGSTNSALLCSAGDSPFLWNGTRRPRGTGTPLQPCRDLAAAPGIPQRGWQRVLGKLEMDSLPPTPIKTQLQRRALLYSAQHLRGLQESFQLSGGESLSQLWEDIWVGKGRGCAHHAVGRCCALGSRSFCKAKASKAVPVCPHRLTCAELLQHKRGGLQEQQQVREVTPENKACFTHWWAQERPVPSCRAALL